MVLFLKVFLTEFIAEMGDKTQLMLIALTSKYKLKDIILGTAAAILVLNGMAVLAGGLVSEFIPDWLIKTIAALAFLYFAASTIAGDDDEEEEEGGKSKDSVRTARRFLYVLRSRARRQNTAYRNHLWCK
ncbi:MAG: TMEM165/GDT1 family protein [Fusicatenibacter saccharivorans]